jgi:hypothetical protein
MNYRALLLSIGLGVVILGLNSPAVAAPNRLVLAFYYPWYDQNTWTNPRVPDHPPDRYMSTDAGVMGRQIDQARGANIDAFVSAWYGPTTNANQTETNLRTLLSLAQGKGFSIGALFETAGPFFHSRDDVQNALAALLRTHAASPAYLRWNGKPVIFFWAPANVPRGAGQSALAAWQAIRAAVDPGHGSLWIADGFDMSLQGVFDGGYLYNVAWAEDIGSPERQWAGRIRAAGGLWVGTVMPGWDDTRLMERGGRYRRDRQGGAWYQAGWAGAASANPDMIVITSWNEFVENTYIEPSAGLGGAYLDLTRSLAAAWKASSPISIPAFAPQPASAQPIASPTRAPTATPSPTPNPTPAPILLREGGVACNTSIIDLCLMP